MSGHGFLISPLVLYILAANASPVTREAVCTNHIEGCEAQPPSTDDNNLIQRSLKQFSVTKGLKRFDKSNIGTLLEALQRRLNERKHAAGVLLNARTSYQTHGIGPCAEKGPEFCHYQFRHIDPSDPGHPCHHPIVLWACPVACNQCNPDGSAPVPICADKDHSVVAMAAKDGLSISGCSELADFCSEVHMQYYCPATCGICEGSAPPPPCADDDQLAVAEAAKQGHSITGCSAMKDFCLYANQVVLVCPATCGKCPGSAASPAN